MKPLAVVLVAVMLAALGCAREGDPGELPAACSGGDAAARFAAALADAPRDVRIDGTAISDCLRGDAPAGDVQLVGSVMVDVARRLRAERRALELGYLLGAVRRGADPGVHSEMVRRVEQEALPLAGSRAFARGERAGRSSG